MSTGKLLLYLVVAVVALVVVSAVISAVIAAIAFVWLLVRVLAFLLVVGGLGYAAYRVHSLLSGGLRSSSDTSEETADEFSMADIGTGGDVSTGATKTDELRRQYLNGEITEEEFERRLERELDTGEFDSIDRELQRERI